MALAVACASAGYIHGGGEFGGADFSGGEEYAALEHGGGHQELSSGGHYEEPIDYYVSVMD